MLPFQFDDLALGVCFVPEPLQGKLRRLNVFSGLMKVKAVVSHLAGGGAGGWGGGGGGGARGAGLFPHGSARAALLHSEAAAVKHHSLPGRTSGGGDQVRAWS